jgi:hypothetical protein
VSWQLELSFAPLCLQNLLTRDPSCVRGNVRPFFLFGSLSRLRPSSFPLASASHLRPLRLPVMPPRTPPLRPWPSPTDGGALATPPYHLPPQPSSSTIVDENPLNPPPSLNPNLDQWMSPPSTIIHWPPWRWHPHPPDPAPPPFLTFPLLLHLRTRYAPWPPRIQTHLALNIRKKEENGLSLPSTQGGTCSWEST